MGKHPEDRPGLAVRALYIDYTFGLLAAAVLFGLTSGHTDAISTNSFFVNLHAASNRSSKVEAFAGGAIFSVGNILLVAAISVAGMAVAFPVGPGLDWCSVRS